MALFRDGGMLHATRKRSTYLTVPALLPYASSLETSRFARSRKDAFVKTVTSTARSLTSFDAKMQSCLPSAA